MVSLLTFYKDRYALLDKQKKVLMPDITYNLIYAMVGIENRLKKETGCDLVVTFCEKTFDIVVNVLNVSVDKQESIKEQIESVCNHLSTDTLKLDVQVNFADIDLKKLTDIGIPESEKIACGLNLNFFINTLDELMVRERSIEKDKLRVCARLAGFMMRDIQNITQAYCKTIDNENDITILVDADNEVVEMAKQLAENYEQYIKVEKMPIKEHTPPSVKN